MASEHRASLSSLSPSEVRRSIGERRPSTPESLRSSTSARRASFQHPPLPPAMNLRRNSAGSYQLPPLPPSTDSLATGTSIPPPALAGPQPPPKDQFPASKPHLMPTTPTRKPVLRQKSPLSNEAYSSPSSSMPGTFPDTPSAQATPPNKAMKTLGATEYSEIESPSPNSKSPKRPGSLRNLLPFKKMRKSLSSSPASTDSRPLTPGAESMMSSGQPTLSKKRSGSFWKRSSSLGGVMSYGKEGESEHRPSTPGWSGDTVTEEGDAGPETPTGDKGIFAKGRRKSGQFFRRSSLSLAAAFNAKETERRPSNIAEQEEGPQAKKATANGTGLPATATVKTTATSGTVNGTSGSGNGITASKAPTMNKQLPEIPISPVTNLEEMDFTLIRSHSPPPQLPEFIGGGSGLGDIFEGIEGFE